MLNAPIDRKMNKTNLSYEPINQTDPERTRDEFLEEQDKIEKMKEEYYKTNLFKSRIIHTEINASLIFQTVLYYHFFYTIICFLIQMFSVSFKLWVFIPNNIAWTRLCLVPIYLIFQMVRLNRGYTANIKEQFPDFIFFKIFTVVLILPCQLMMVVGNQVLPIDYATALIEILFLIGEIVLSVRAMVNVTRRQAAVYYLRNTPTNVFALEKTIKSSNEIEEELFFHFPNLMNNLNQFGHEKNN